MASNVRITDEIIKFRRTSLAATSSIRTGGIAPYYSRPESLSELKSVVHYAAKHTHPYRAIGALTNTLASDASIKEILIDTQGLQAVRIEGSLVIAQSGALMDTVINLVVEAGLGGLEELAGLPGTVGGAVYGNSGANTKAVADTLSWIEYLDSSATLHRKPVDRGDFGYRHSPFTTVHEQIITEVAFALTPLAQNHAAKQRAEAYRQKRRAKGHFLYPSLGSIFKNPSRQQSAGSLIDSLGLKGYTIGGASVSPEHANFIINAHHTAASADVAALIAYIKERVADAYDIPLEEEINYLGPWSR